MKDYNPFGNIMEQPCIVVNNETVIQVSQTFADVIEYAVDELLSKKITELFDILKVGPNFSIRNIDEEMDYFLFTKSLEVRFVNIKVVNESDKKIYVIKEKSELRFENKFNYLNQLCLENVCSIAIYNVPEYTLLKANQMYLGFLDAPFNTFENTIGRLVSEIIPGWENSSAETIWNSVVADGKPVHVKEFEFTNFNKGITYWDITFIPVYDNGIIKYITSNSYDVTDRVINRKQLQEQLEVIKNKNKQLEEKNKVIEQQRKQLEATIDNMNDAIMVYGKERKLVLLNSEAYKMYPCLTSTALTEIQKIYDNFDLDGNLLAPEKHASARAYRGEIVRNERVVVKGRNYCKIIEVNATPIFDDNKNVDSIVLSHRDITEQVRNQQQLLGAEREKNEALEKAMEMKDEFLSLISHEFRTPLNVINSAIQTLNFIYAEEMTDKVKEYIQTIRQNTYRQLRLVNNLLDITRADAGRIKINKKNIDIVFLTKAITESVYQYALNKGVRITFVSKLSKKVIGTDDEKYERIILNLLSNAIKFSPEGKSIVVTLRSLKSNICVEVKDSGIGIPPNKIDLIFERFGQVDSSLSRQAEGTGIGLSLVKRFVEALGGSVTVKSKVGKGTTFSILLPNETVVEEHDGKLMDDLMMDNRLVQTTNIEFSDIYL